MSSGGRGLVQLALGPSGMDSRNSVKIDGEEWLVREVSVRAAAHEATKATVDILVESAEVTAEADVLVNGHYLSDELAWAFYQDLKAKFDEEGGAHGG